MTAFTILAVLAVLCALGPVITTIRFANDLRARGERADPALVLWMVFHTWHVTNALR